MTEALLKTDLGGLPLIARGKVRDLYALGDNLLFVATDRISAFDHILGSGIPDQGAILPQTPLRGAAIARPHPRPSPLPAADRRPQHGRPPRADVPRRMRRPRLSLRL